MFIKNDKTHKINIALLVSLIISSLIISSCSQFEASIAQAKPASRSINLVEEQNLLQTRQIKVFVEGELQANIEDQAVIDELLGSLKGDHEIITRITCPTYYDIELIMQDGTQHKFGLACGPQDPSFLRGSQPYWMDSDIRVPFEFARLLQALLK